MMEAPLDRVLVVDDDPDVAAVMSMALTRLMGATVHVCTASRDALESARSFRPHLVLLDVMMPEMDGPAILKALRADESTASVPVIFVSAGADGHDAPRYRELGAAGVIPKPFDPVTLPLAIREICRGSSAGEPYAEPLDVLRGQYAAQLPEKLATMGALADGLVAGGWQRATVESLLRLTHRVAGAAGLYGLDAVSRAAGILEAMLKRDLAGAWPPSRSPVEVATLVRAVARVAPRERRARRRATQGPRV